jgi:uncharacterized protein (TIGR03437 family)
MGITPANLMVFVNCAALAKGAYAATIRITGADGSVATLLVTLTVDDPPNLTVTPPTLTFSGISPPSQEVTVKAIDPATSAEVAVNFTAETSAPWIHVTPDFGHTTAHLQVTVDSSALVPVPGGQLTVKPVCASMASKSVPITITTAPVIVYDPIVDAASFNSPVSPGSLFTMFGVGLGPDNGVSFTPTPAGTVRTTLGGTQVLVGDNLAAIPLLFVQANQINAMLPYYLAGKSSVQVVAEHGGVRSVPVTVKLYFPPNLTLFTSDGSGKGQAAALNVDGQMNSPSHPADRNSVIVFYGTGGSQTDPPMEDGALNPMKAASCVTQPTVQIGGKDAKVQYAGLAPGLVAGVIQLNVEVPAGAPAGVVPVTVQIGQNQSPAGVTVVLR